MIVRNLLSSGGSLSSNAFPPTSSSDMERQSSRSALTVLAANVTGALFETASWLTPVTEPYHHRLRRGDKAQCSDCEMISHETLGVNGTPGSERSRTCPASPAFSARGHYTSRCYGSYATRTHVRLHSIITRHRVLPLQYEMYLFKTLRTMQHTVRETSCNVRWPRPCRCR